MFTVKIIWNQGDTFPSHSVYSTNKYVVTYLKDDSIQLLVNNEQQDTTDIRLSDGATAYIMNSNGSTIDVLRTSRR